MDQQTQENNATETWVTLDANEAASNVAYRLSEVIAIYPITPSTPVSYTHLDVYKRQAHQRFYTCSESSAADPAML